MADQFRGGTTSFKLSTAPARFPSSALADHIATLRLRSPTPEVRHPHRKPMHDRQRARPELPDRGSKTHIRGTSHQNIVPERSPRPAIHGWYRRRPGISPSIETVTVRSKISTAARVDILQSRVVSFLSQERNQEVRERRTTRTQYRRAGTCRDRKLFCKCVVQVPAPSSRGLPDMVCEFGSSKRMQLFVR